MIRRQGERNKIIARLKVHERIHSEDHFLRVRVWEMRGKHRYAKFKPETCDEFDGKERKKRQMIIAKQHLQSHLD